MPSWLLPSMVQMVENEVVALEEVSASWRRAGRFLDTCNEAAYFSAPGRTDSPCLRSYAGWFLRAADLGHPLQEEPMSFMSYAAPKFETHDEADAFVEGFKQWLADSITQWAREHPHEAQGLEHAVGQLPQPKTRRQRLAAARLKRKRATHMSSQGEGSDCALPLTFRPSAPRRPARPPAPTPCRAPTRTWTGSRAGVCGCGSSVSPAPRP